MGSNRIDDKNFMYIVRLHKIESPLLNEILKKNRAIIV